MLADIFLEANKIKLDDEKFYVKMEDIVVKVATDKINKNDLKEIFKDFIKNNSSTNKTSPKKNKQ